MCLADRIMVMYAGRIVEQGTREEVLQQPLHPYTRALLACARAGDTANDGRFGKQPMPTIAGSPPDLMHSTCGCDFESRCQDRMGVCSVRIPEEIPASSSHKVRCFKFGG